MSHLNFYKPQILVIKIKAINYCKELCMFIVSYVENSWDLYFILLDVKLVLYKYLINPYVLNYYDWFSQPLFYLSSIEGFGMLKTTFSESPCI